MIEIGHYSLSNQSTTLLIDPSIPCLKISPTFMFTVVSVSQSQGTFYQERNESQKLVNKLVQKGCYLCISSVTYYRIKFSNAKFPRDLERIA